MKTNEISYRVLTASDSKDYRDIRLESLKLYPQSYGGGRFSYEEQVKLPKLMFERAFEGQMEDRFVIGAFDNDTLIGISGFVPHVPEEGQPQVGNAGMIIQVYVKAEYRGRKIGLALTNITIDEAFKMDGIDQIILGVKKGNITALRVYEQAGFRIHEFKENETNDIHEDVIWMFLKHDKYNKI
jgi:ribosomal protein S18 acetylase RimI-like enzyme